jgi:hypothetical protein
MTVLGRLKILIGYKAKTEGGPEIIERKLCGRGRKCLTSLQQKSRKRGVSKELARLADVQRPAAISKKTLWPFHAT